MIDIAPTTEVENRNRDLAIAAASQAADALAELLRYAREGDGSMSGPFGTDVVEQLLDATKMAMEIEGQTGDERGRVNVAIMEYLEGWA